MDQKHVNYSQCWEDPLILLEALSIQPTDRVLSVTSGGDNTLALLLAGAAKVDSIDLNPAQNYLLELKHAAAMSLSYDDYLELLGVRDSKRRWPLFERIRADISPAANTWWSSQQHLIEKGVISSGRFEQFTIFFARHILPLIHSRRTISDFLACRDIQEQQDVYEQRWNSWRWRVLFGLASHRVTLKRFARQRGMFSYAQGQTVADVYRQRLERHVTSVPIQGNYFLHYSLMGRYDTALPPYLEEHGYEQLRKVSASALSIETCGVLSYLQSMPDATFSKFNLSDIFEALSPEENDTVWQEIIRTATSGASIAYWNNLVRRSCPARYAAFIRTDEHALHSLRAKDRVFFYDSFHVHTIVK